MSTAQTETKPRELPITVEQFRDAKRAERGAPSFPVGRAPVSSATRRDRDALRGVVVYRARKNSRGDHRVGTHRDVVDVARLELVAVGPTWTTYHDLDYSFARHQMRTADLLAGLAAGGIAGFHRTEARLDAALAAAA